MATAVQPSAGTRTPDPRTRLAVAGLSGAVFVVAGVVAAAYLVPLAWRQYVDPVLGPVNGFANSLLRGVAQLAAAATLVWAGGRAAGATPVVGVRGGIFVGVSALVTTFFVTRAVGLNLESSPAGLPITLAVLGALLAGTFVLLSAPKVQEWMRTIDEQGLLHAFHYKRTQGVRTRRYTLLGILLLTWTGVWTLINHESVGRGDWVLRLPFVDGPGFPVLSDVQYSVPLLLAAVSLWLAWRVVNMPTFADFLIATEAEMNKVSWPTRKGLVQDTIVVLVATAALTVFLLGVDVFWGWLLSRPMIGVLPSKSADAVQKAQEQDRPKW